MDDNGNRSNASVATILGDRGFPAVVNPDKVALQWDHGQRTYGELKDRARSLAAGFLSMGVPAGSRVVVHLFNRGETFEVYFACAYARMTLVPTNFRFRAQELADVIEDVEPALVITQAELVAEVQEALTLAGQSPELLILDDDTSGLRFEGLATGAQLEGWSEPNDPHLVLFSSGTTGRPKGVIMSHRSILGAGAQSTIAYPHYGPEMVSLIVPPMFNAAGINDLAASTFMSGGTVAIMPSRGWTAEGLADYTDRYGVTHAIWFPTMLKNLMQLPEDVRRKLSSMRSVVIGGEHCTAAVQRQLRQVFPNIRFTNTYGLTEGGLITCLSHDEFEKAPDSVGRVSPAGQALEVRDSSGAAPVLPGETGEIWTTSNFLPEGYWRSEELNRDAYNCGWLKTGDLGRIDENGFLHLEGRSRDLIISKGQNIYPAEIESVLMEINGVQACAVLAVPDEEYGERPHAVVVRASGTDLTSATILEHLKTRLASYKCPAGIDFRDALPITDNNKVSKRELLPLVLADLGLAGGN